LCWEESGKVFGKPTNAACDAPPPRQRRGSRRGPRKYCNGVEWGPGQRSQQAWAKREGTGLKNPVGQTFPLLFKNPLSFSSTGKVSYCEWKSDTIS